MAKKKEIRLRKIPLGPFLDALLELYNEGLDYVDLVGTAADVQDTIGIAFTKEYMSKEMSEKYKGIDQDTLDELKKMADEMFKDLDLSDEDDINQII